MSKALLNKKSTLTSRRNVIIYIIATILILGIVAGFTNVFHTDNRRFAAKWGETFVIEAQPPTTGSPADHDLLTNLQYTAYRIHHSKYFKGYTDGKVSADITVGRYTQYLTNTRVVYDQNIVFTETISTSSLKNLAEQKYADNGVIIFRGADKISGKNVTFSKTASQMSYEQYSKNYGAVPNQLSKYIINKDTILSVKDENAQSAPRLNGNGNDDGVSFDVPEHLVPNADGNYVFTLTLDPTASSLYYRNEVRTLGGADQNPKFYSVKVTVTVDPDWYPISTRTLEEYDIEIPVLGAMRCYGDNFETFTMIDDKNGKIPERDFFQPYVDAAKAHPDYKPPEIEQTGPLSAADYLASAFERYLSGESNLDLTANINITGIPVLDKLSAYDLDLSVNLDTLDIQAMLGSGLYVKYADDKVYIKNNDINGYVSIEDAKKLTDDPILSALLSGIGKLDMNKIFGGDMLDVIFSGCEMTEKDGITEIPMSFSLDLSDIIPSLNQAQVEAAIKIKTADKSLNSISGTVTLGDITVDIDATPLKTVPAFPSTDGATDLSGIFDFVSDAAATAAQKTYGIDGTLTLNDMTVGLSAYVDRTNGLKAEAILNVAGLDVLVKYVDGTVYASALGVNVVGTTDELPALMTALLDMTDFGKYEKQLKLLLPKSLNQIVNMLSSLTVDETTLAVSMSYLGMPIDLTLTRGEGRLQSLAFTADINIALLDIKADISADLKFSEPTVREVTAPTVNSALSFADLATLIKQIDPYLDANYYTADIDGYVEIDGTQNKINGNFAIDKITDKKQNVTGTAATASVSALGQNIEVTYIDGTAYVAIGNIKAKLNVADIDSLMSAVTKLVNSITAGDVLPEIEINDFDNVIKSLNMTDGALNLALSVAGYDVTANINLQSGKIHVSIAGGIKAELDITLSTVQKSHNITAPTDGNKYLNAVELSDVLNAAARITDAGGVTIPAYVTYGDKTYNATVQASLRDAIAARITLDALGLDVTLVGDTVYMSLGEIKLCGTLDQAKALYAELSNHYDLPPIDGLLQALPQGADIQSLLGKVLDSVTSLTADNGVIYAQISANGIGVNVGLKSDLSQISASLSVNGKAIDMTMSVVCGCENITAPLGDYNSIGELNDMLPAVFALTDSKAFAATFNASTTYGDGYAINGNAIIDLADGIKVSASLGAFGQTIDISYVDDTVYFGLQGLRFKLSVDQTSDVMPKLTSILGALGITLPDLGGAIDNVKNNIDLDKIENAVTTGIATVKAFTISNGVINIILSYDGYSVALDIDCSAQTGITVTVCGEADGTKLNLSFTLTPTDKAVTTPDGEYSDIAELMPMLDTVADVLVKGGIHTVATVTIGDITLNAAIDCTIEDGMLRAVVTENSLGLSVVLIGDTAYIEVGGIKVSGQLSDIQAIMDAVIPNLPDAIRPYIIKMTELMMGVVPSDGELTTDGKTDVAKTIDTVLAMLTSLSVSDGNINVNISRGVLSATLNIATDLSDVHGDVTLTFNGIGGPFGDCYAMSFGLNLQNITASNVTVQAVNADKYVKASGILAALDCVLPLARQSAFDLGISVTVYGQTITGNVYIDLGNYTLDTIVAKAKLDVAGATVALTIQNKTLYLDINDGAIRMSQSLDKASIKDILAQIDEALPKLGINDKITSALDTFNKDISISDILDKITLSPTQNGMALAAAFGKTSVNADIVMADGALGAVNVNCDIGGKQVDVALNVTLVDGVLCGIQTTQADIMGVELDLSLTLQPTTQRDVTPDGEYIQIAEFIPYISPIMSLVDNATTATALTVNLSDMIIEVMGKQIAVSGKVDISFNPVNVRAVLTLFDDSEADKVDLTVVYADSVLYISVGKISLKFNINSDMSTLNEAIAPYLPKSLKNLGDLGALSPIFAIIDSVKKITDAQDATAVMSILFDNDNAYGKSTVLLVADMLRLYKRGSDGSIAVGVTVMEAPFEVTLNVQPIIAGDYLDFKLNTAVSNLLSLNLTAKLSFSDTAFTVAAPEDADSYTPVVDFVTAVINAVNTITAKVPDTVTTDEAGNVTTVSQTAFEVDTFAFDYDIFKTVTEIDESTGETVEVKDDAGRAQIAKDDAGNKIKEKTIQISNVDGQKALRFGITTTKVKRVDGVETKSTKLAIEAHIRLGIIGGDGKAQTGFPIELDLYVQPLDTAEKGLAYLYYREANGYGEKISIDYTSIMQIAAAVLDILSVDDATVQSLLGEYRLDIDKAVFESMAIAGLDKITTLLNNLVLAVNEAKDALSDAKAAWNRVQDAEDVDALIYESLNDVTKDGETATVKAYLDSAISHIKAAIALFDTDEEETETAEEQDNMLNGALVGKVVNSVYFNSANSVLSAYVDNAIATGTDGWAVVSVKSAGDKINNIGVKNLDVNTAKLNTFNMGFAPTQNVTVTIPDDYTDENTADDKVRYADLSNLKHLIFDVMNTANMLEFDIGGLNTGDAINVHMKLGADWLANLQLNIRYNAKVKIIKTGEDKNGKPIYKTAAAVEIHNEKTQLEILGIGSKIIVPDCTTRLYFYDDVIYIQGVRSWTTDKIERVVGTVTDIYCIASYGIGKKETRYPTINSTEYVTDTTGNFDYVEVMYTVDELFWMISNDMNKFLNEFLFYLIPITTEKIAGQDIRGLITDNIGNSSSDTVNDQNTIAQIIKQYTYDNGQHTLRIGLKELAGSSSLSDLTVKIKGANDGDDNVLDNYISSLSVNTSIANIITVDLKATLNNVAVTADGSDIYSKGLAPTNVTLENGKYSLNGANYVYDCYNYDRNTIYTLDGLTYFTADGNGLYIENGSFAPALLRPDSSDEFVWTSTSANTRYCDSVYKFGDTNGKYYYTTSLSGYGYRYAGNDTYYMGTDESGNKYVYRVENGNQIRVQVKGITSSLLAEVTRDAQGNITAVTNRNGGVQWTRPWQAAYEAAQAS